VGSVKKTLMTQSFAAQFKDIENRYNTAQNADLEHLIVSYESLRKQVAQVGLFSENESIEEVPSTELKYLVIDCRLASLYERRSVNRMADLKFSREIYVQFLSRCNSYGLLGKKDQRSMDLLSSGKQSLSASDPGSQRQAKIERFQLAKQYESFIERVDESDESLNDEELRDLSIKLIKLCIVRSFESLDSIFSELELLKHMPDKIEEAPQSNDQSERLDRIEREPRSLLSPTGRPLQPFVLTKSRKQLQKEVFRPDHSLPTMSIDEYLAEEQRQGNILQQQAQSKEASDSEDEDSADKKTMEARRWDEYKEAHPRGSGNIMNRG